MTALATASLCLAGCSLGPDYHAPDLALPAAYRGTPATAAVAWPATDWWRGFNSPTLNQLIEQARGGNFDIQAAIARVRQADAQVRISGSPLLPTVDGSGRADYQRAGFTRRGGGSSVGTAALGGLGAGASTVVTGGATGRSHYFDSRAYSVGPNVSYEIDLWGRLRAADIARAQLLAGTSDIVTALQAQITLFNDLDILAQVRLARFQALLDLYKALGGGWDRGMTIAPTSTIFHGVL